MLFLGKENTQKFQSQLGTKLQIANFGIYLKMCESWDDYGRTQRQQLSLLFRNEETQNRFFLFFFLMVFLSKDYYFLVIIHLFLGKENTQKSFINTRCMVMRKFKTRTFELGFFSTAGMNEYSGVSISVGPLLTCFSSKMGLFSMLSFKRLDLY